MSHVADWLFRRPSLDELAQEEERAIADASVRRFTWARDEARREFLRFLRAFAAERVRESMDAEARGLPHEHIPLAVAVDLLRHDPLPPLVHDEATPGDDSSSEPSWEAEHGPATASSPYRSPAPMPPKVEKKHAVIPSRTSQAAHVASICVWSFAICLVVAQFFVWCIG